MESSCVVYYLEEVHLDRRQPRLCHQGIYFLGGGLMTWAMRLWNVENYGKFRSQWPPRDKRPLEAC